LKKIKPGYIIIAIILSFFIYKKFFDNSEEKAFYSKSVEEFLTDLRHQDYFALQNRLSESLKKCFSVEDAKSFIDSINLGRKYKFELKDYDKNKNLITVQGVLIFNSKNLPLTTTFEDNNGTLRVKRAQIGISIIKDKNLTFPLNCKKEN